MGRASRYVGPVGVLSWYGGYVNCSPNESLLRANIAPFFFRLVLIVDVPKENYGRLEMP
jgi:hypothetical protein